MDHSLDRQKSDKQRQSGLSASLQIFERILDWLAGLIKLTDDEQRDAGIYVGRQKDE